MKKIPSLFVRDYEKIVTAFNPSHVSLNNDGSYGMGGRAQYSKGRFLATRQVTPGCEWVLKGEGIATRKWDGTAVMIKEGQLYKRYDAKHGKKPPKGFVPCQEPDTITGHWPGWVKLDHLNRGGADKWIWDAFWNTFPIGTQWGDGTYEAIGPKINGNPEGIEQHQLIMHGYQLCEDAPREFDGIKRYLSDGVPIEGIVFHYPDGRMCKVKRTDFGLKWPL